MKSIVFGTFLLFTCVLGESDYISDEILEKRERKLYDVQQLALDSAENIEASETIDRREEFLMTSNLQLLNFLNIVSVLTNSLSDVTNSSCLNDLSYIKENIDFKNYQNSWALKMLDSFAKPEGGILEGNVRWLGDFDECKSVYAPKKENSSDIGGFHGQYCTLGVTVQKFLPLSIGMCLPDTCKPSDFIQLINTSNIIPAFNHSGIDLNVASVTCKVMSLEISNGGIVTLCIMSLFFILVFLGSSVTAYKYLTDSNTTSDPSKNSAVSLDYTSEHETNERRFERPLVFTERSPTKLRVFIDKCDPFLNCFCIFTNGSKLLNTDATEGQLLCLHGIRFLSMTWVILGHTYTSVQTVVRSLKSTLTLADNLPFQAVLNGWYSVDSFYMLSGFLMSYLYFQESAKRQGKTPWLYFYAHRYLRLTPVYMIVLAFFATVMRVLGSGPFWPDTNVDEGCQNGWWSNIIYLNNFLQTNSEANNQCMSVSWYLATDMQFFVISPLFLITLWRWPKVGYSTLALFLLGCWISSFLITYHYNLPAGTMSDVTKIAKDPTFMTRWNDYMDKIYIKPYTRIAPYLIGIGLGYILFKRKTIGIKSNRRTLWIGWLLAVSAGLYCIYGTYHQTPSLLAASFYNALARTFYGLSLSWLIFVCLTGQGGIVDRILSYKLFIPLSRLTYCAYLLHPIFVTIYIASMKSTIVFSHQAVVIWYLGLLIVTYAFSLLVSLAFESPIIRLEKLARNKFKSK